MKSKLIVGVIGVGILGEQYVKFFREHPATQLRGVADIRADVAARVGAGAGVPAYSDCQEMLKAEALDLVVVATPDPAHRDPAGRAGRPVCRT